ncbi:MAG: aldehyde dehydrogenase family protein, partial [Pseudomonadota bacterium]
MFINGEWRDAAGGKSFDVVNPADSSVISSVPDGGAEDARAAIEVADAAFPMWSHTTAYERADILMKAHRLMMERREELARTMTEEQGKPLAEARGEVLYAASFVEFYA